jgi:hypothetical protein
MKAVLYFETSGAIHPVTQHHIPEDMSLQKHEKSAIFDV